MLKHPQVTYLADKMGKIKVGGVLGRINISKGLFSLVSIVSSRREI